MSIERSQPQANGATPSSATATESPGVRPLINEEDELHQRAEMERELAEQARTLDPSALHPQHEIPGAAPTDAPESERVRGETLSLDSLLTCVGRTLVDANGEEIGAIGEIYFDEATRLPEWIGADVPGVLGSKRVVAPVHGSYVLDDVISVPYARDVVLASGAGEMLITVEHEEKLYKHYGLPYSREASPTGLSEGDAGASGTADAGPFLSADAANPAIVPERGGASGASNDAVPSLGLEALAYVLPVEGEVTAPAHEAPRLALPADDAVPRFARRFATGAVAGLVATIPMTVAMVAMHRRLPRRERQPLPPREVTENIARALHVDRFARSHDAMTKMTLAAHLGYGMAAGALYAMLPSSKRAAPARGAGFGAAVWSASYLGWLPATGLSKPATGDTRRRNALMIASNVLWGTVMAAIVARMSSEGGDDGAEESSAGRV